MSCISWVRGPFWSKPKTITLVFVSSLKHAALRIKSRDWLARNKHIVSGWSDMSNRGLLFIWVSTIMRVGLVQSGHHYHLTWRWTTIIHSLTSPPNLSKKLVLQFVIFTILFSMCLFSASEITGFLYIVSFAGKTKLFLLSCINSQYFVFLEIISKL